MTVRPGGPEVARKGECAMYLPGSQGAGTWHLVALDGGPAVSDPVASLDVQRLHDLVLAPVLGIGDERTDKRIDFVGGIRGPAELKRLVDGGKAAVAFAMFPTTIDDLVAIADAGGIMPPKSTWFEPKLRDGLLVHLIASADLGQSAAPRPAGAVDVPWAFPRASRPGLRGPHARARG